VLDPENEEALDYQKRSKVETLSKENTMDEATEQLYLKGMQEYVNKNYVEAIQIWNEILKDQPYNKQVLKAVQAAEDKMSEE
jgi:outer membrane protein assembly factor BamD (BamD/ComL family)